MDVTCNNPWGKQPNKSNWTPSTHSSPSLPKSHTVSHGLVERSLKRIGQNPWERESIYIYIYWDEIRIYFLNPWARCESTLRWFKFQWRFKVFNSHSYDCSLKVSLQESLKAPLKNIISRGFTHRISQGVTPTYILSHGFLSLTHKVSLKVSLRRSFAQRFSESNHGHQDGITSNMRKLYMDCLPKIRLKLGVILWWLFIQIRGSSLEEITSYFLRLFARGRAGIKIVDIYF